MSEEPTRSFEVRWDDIGLNGRPRNTRYLEHAATAWLGFLTGFGRGSKEPAKAGVAAVSPGEEVRCPREVFPLARVVVGSRVVGLGEEGARWRFEHRFVRGSGEEAAVVRTLGAWTDLRARRTAPPPSGPPAVVSSARADDCEVITSTSRKASEGRAWVEQPPPRQGRTWGRPLLSCGRASR
ncbi:thioesterase family protein [Streptomyces olivaceoviridis]